MRDWKKTRDKLESNGYGGRYGQVLVALEIARELLIARVSPLPVEPVPLTAASGRVLGQTIMAPEYVPPFDRSVLDGYAIRSGDVAQATPENPVTLAVTAEIPAGYIAPHPVTPGTAIKVFTGTPLPVDADTVVRYEETTAGPATVTIFRSLKPGEGVAPKGEEIQAGETVLPAGVVLGSPHIGLLASLGLPTIPVHRRPRIGIFCTGDELWEGNGPLPPGKIHPTNLHTLAALVRETGGEPVLFGTTRDRRPEVANRYQQAVTEDVDLVLSTGGVSAGDYDVVKDAMADAGAENLFWKVALRPGAPVAAGYLAGRLLIGLSGNPAGVIIIFWLLVAPVIAALAGKPWTLRHSIAQLAHPVHKAKGMRGFQWAIATETGGKLTVTLAKEQKCGVMRSYLLANCLVELPAGPQSWPLGRPVIVYWLPGRELAKTLTAGNC